MEAGRISRRIFLKNTLAALAVGPLVPLLPSRADSAGTALPSRVFSRLNQPVTFLGLGGYHIGWTTEALAQATIEAALEEGVRFFDTAESYGPHISEERYGRYLSPKYRSQIFLMTKSTAKTAEQVDRHINASLERLKTDYLDLWQIHAISSPQDVDQRLANGVLAAALQACRDGRVRSLGFTGHASPDAHLRMIELTRDDWPFAAVQMPVNPVDAVSRESFIGKVLPALRELPCSVLAMKTLADGRFFDAKQVGERQVWQTDQPIVPGVLTLADVFNFVWSLPVTVLITGAENPQYLREKAILARNFMPLSSAERERLAQKVLAWAELGKVEYYKRG